MGCGTCAAACPVDAITMPGFTDEQVMAQISAALEDNPEEKVLTFACNWCSYAGADQAGIEKREYPESIRIVRTMCSGRVDKQFVDHAFEEGAGAVLVTGCHIGDCHYIDANTYTEERVERWMNKMDDDEEDRLQLEWVSAAEGQRFAAKATEMDEVVREFLDSRARADGGRCCNGGGGACGTGRHEYQGGAAGVTRGLTDDAGDADHDAGAACSTPTPADDPVDNSFGPDHDDWLNGGGDD
jgi:coenzyme F420-reducing hydrogenase delta subunit